MSERCELLTSCHIDCSGPVFIETQCSCARRCLTNGRETWSVNVNGRVQLQPRLESWFQSSQQIW